MINGIDQKKWCSCRPNRAHLLRDEIDLKQFLAGNPRLGLFPYIQSLTGLLAPSYISISE
jgi:hypothetical protein